MSSLVGDGLVWSYGSLAEHTIIVLPLALVSVSNCYQIPVTLLWYDPSPNIWLIKYIDLGVLNCRKFGPAAILSHSP